MKLVIVLTTFPDGERAKIAARCLVEEHLAACVQIDSAIQSIYRWQGAVEEAPEVRVLIKTSAPLIDSLHARLVELHPYEVMQFFVIEPCEISPEFRQWWQEQLMPAPVPPAAGQ